MPARTRARTRSDRQPSASKAIAKASVRVDQSNYDQRLGYDPEFLGIGALSVPLPKLNAARKRDLLTFADRGNPREFELRYWNYSVAMSKSRRLAIFSAVNIDRGQRADVGKREGDVWYYDMRIDRSAQIGSEFYGGQAGFRAPRIENPFDKGHLVRRLDATWGATVTMAKMHGDDSFHFTNCAPQFWKYNQGSSLWLGIEEYVLGRLVREDRGCVFNGPIFDGPSAAGRPYPDPAARKSKDKLFGGVAIPKYFWKLLVVRENGRLSATAYVLSQEDLINAIGRLVEPRAMSDQQAKVFQFPLAGLSKLTGLSFGRLAEVETRALERPPRQILRLREIVLD